MGSEYAQFPSFTAVIGGALFLVAFYVVVGALRQRYRKRHPEPPAPRRTVLVDGVRVEIPRLTPEERRAEIEAEHEWIPNRGPGASAILNNTAPTTPLSDKDTPSQSSADGRTPPS